MSRETNHSRPLTLSHRIEYAVAKVLAGVCRQLGPKTADRFGAWLGRVVHRLLSSRRELATDNMRQAQGLGLTDTQIESAVERVFESVGRMMIEFARFPLLTHDDVRAMVKGEGQEAIQQAAERGKGGIILTAHFGNHELMGLWVQALGYQIDHLVADQSNRLVQTMINDLRRAQGIGIHVVPTGVKGVFRSLQNNHFIGMIADQHAPAESVILNFFGRPVSVPRGPAVFARRCDCPILPFVLVRERYDQHRIIAGEPIYPPNTGDQEADELSMTRRHNQFFEDRIREYPEMWMWTHNRWKLPQKTGNPVPDPT